MMSAKNFNNIEKLSWWLMFVEKLRSSHHDCLKKKISAINADEVFRKYKHNNKRNENEINETLLRRKKFVKLDINRLKNYQARIQRNLWWSENFWWYYNKISNDIAILDDADVAIRMWRI